MKNIFKFMAIALVSFSMIACGDKDNTDDNNNGGNGGGSDTPTATYKVTWGDAVQTLGFKDAYNYTSSFYILDAAAGLENDNYTLPRFRFGFDLDTDPQYGCALTAQWNYTIQGQNYAGNSLFPTDVFENGYYTSSYSWDETAGDWQLNQYDEGADFHLTNAQFDATTRTLSGSITVQMFSYDDVYDYFELNEIENPTDEQFLAALTASTKKNLTIEMTNFVFDAASSK